MKMRQNLMRHRQNVFVHEMVNSYSYAKPSKRMRNRQNVHEYITTTTTTTTTATTATTATTTTTTTNY